MRHSLRRALVITAILSILFSLASALVPSTATMTYDDIDGCMEGCRVAAGGFPFPYLFDYPGLSPSGTVSWTGALFSQDKILWSRFALCVLSWCSIFAVALFAMRKRL